MTARSVNVAGVFSGTVTKTTSFEEGL